ncbi:NUDIX hydrolase [Saccharopolyspora sp. SCSIO 74807]|uniref:NUDIX hydrolase n=1 Tax=Saccharopolyspora sp. SCSIO 74807 TaxID=3118084 RepID=UPI0030D15BD4
MTTQEEPEHATSASDSVTVRAAGAVLWRPDDDGTPRIALVHRPRYDDWTLPKGKLDPGETPAHAAAREVLEETGFGCVLSGELAQIRYSVPAPGGYTGKRVDYFAARAGQGLFAVNEEVDELRWLSTAAARELLTYPHDGHVLDAFDALPLESRTLLLVRHAKAGKRSEFTGDDTQRPLSAAGLRQRDALHTLLPLFGPQRVYSAPRVRCTQTVQPVADDLGIAVADEPLLTEEQYQADPAAAVRRLLRIAGGSGTSVVCSQGGVIPDLVGRLTESAGLRPDEVLSSKGSVWTLRFCPDANSGNGSGPLLRLVAADYLPDPRG